MISKPGPFHTEAEASAAAHALVPPPPGWSILRTPENYRLLTEACHDAGVELGAYDDGILAWLAQFEDSTCAVIAGLITRAHTSGKESGQ